MTEQIPAEFLGGWLLLGKMVLGLAGTLALLAGGLKLWARVPPAPALAPAQPLPEGFLWGVSASGFQSEGGEMDSNMLRLNRKRVGDARKPQDPYGKSVDFRHRYREDIALARAMGVNTFRLGISWERVEPEKGQFDEAELAYYDDVLMALREAGMQPLVTLHHFTHPGWVEDQGGWTNPRTVDDYLDYVKLIATRYHGDVRWWITFNETALWIAGTVKLTAPGWPAMLDIRRNFISAHRRAYEAIHAADADAMVSSNMAWTGDANLRSRVVERFLAWVFQDQATDHMDYIGLDYYSSDVRGVSGHHWDWDPEPAGLYRALRTLARRYPGKPIVIAENGMATENGKPRADGVLREDALRDCVYWVQRARADGIPMAGYFVWSLTDNFEWGSYAPRFGLYTVDVLTDPTLTRRPTAAVAAYREVIAAGGVGPAYRPLIPPRGAR